MKADPWFRLFSPKFYDLSSVFFTGYNRPVWLFATVTRGYDAVVGAKVVASIENPAAENYTKIELKMRDDGLGADMAKEDGTYSAYIVNSKSIGKHAIFVEVTGVPGTKVKSVTSYSRAPELRIGMKIEIQGHWLHLLAEEGLVEIFSLSKSFCYIIQEVVFIS